MKLCNNIKLISTQYETSFAQYETLLFIKKCCKIYKNLYINSILIVNYVLI